MEDLFPCAERPFRSLHYEARRLVKPMSELGIFKNTIHFRQANEIDPKRDPDAPVLEMGTVKRSLYALWPGALSGKGDG